MATEPTEKKPKKRNGPRKNYQKEMERVTTYLETVIRIKEREQPYDERADTDLTGSPELRAYKDVLDFIGSAK